VWITTRFRDEHRQALTWLNEHTDHFFGVELEVVRIGGSAPAPHREEFEAAYGRPLQWDVLDGRKACRISESASGAVENEPEHEKYIEFFIDAGQRFGTAISAVNGTLLLRRMMTPGVYNDGPMQPSGEASAAHSRRPTLLSSGALAYAKRRASEARAR
jgi:uncharacterized protein DUF4268